MLAAIIGFCEDEVERQGYERLFAEWGLRTLDMLRAWAFAMGERDAGRPVTPKAIKEIGRLVDPVVNAQGWRKVEVVVGRSRARGLHWGSIPKAVAALCRAEPTLTPDEFYLEFERIHPFADGNGRAGKVLHNWLSGTLERPVLIRDYFGDGLP